MMPLRAAGAVIERRRLAVEFERASRYRVTVVSGASGTGKSTAIDAHMRTLQGARATYVPHVNACELLPFVRGLSNELSTHLAADGRGLGAAWLAAKQAARPATALGKWFAGQLGTEQTTIALDDLHVVVQCDEIAEFIAAAVVHSAADVRWVLGVRSTAPFPIAAWLAADICDLHIDESVLAFTDIEAIALAARFAIPESKALEALRAAGAHAGKLSAAVRTPSDETIPEPWEKLVVKRFDATIGSLRPDRLAALLALLRLPALEDDLVEGIPFGNDVIARLEGDAPEAFRWPDKLRFTTAFGAVAERSSLAPEAMRSAATHVAVALLESKQRTSDALRVAALAGAPVDVVRLLERHGFRMLTDGYGDVVDAAVLTLSPQERRLSSVALALEAMRESHLGRHDVGDAWFLHAADAAPDAATKARVEYLYAKDLLRRNRLDCIPALQRIAEQQVDRELQASAIATLATAYGSAQRWTESRRCMDAALARIDEIADLSVRATVYRHAAFGAALDHDAAAAERYGNLALSLATEHGYDDVALTALGLLCYVAINLKDDMPAGLELLASLQRRASLVGSTWFRRYGLFVLIDLHASSGAWHEVTRAENLLAGEEVENDTRHADEALVPTRALRFASRGDFPNAYRVIAGTADRQFDVALRWSEIAMYAAMAGLASEALDAVRQARINLRRFGLSRDAASIRARLNLALATLLLGNVRAASRLLSEAQSGVAAFPRLRCFHALLHAMVRQSNGARNHEEILERLAELDQSGLGGVAMMIDAIPFRRLGLKHAS